MVSHPLTLDTRFFKEPYLLFYYMPTVREVNREFIAILHHLLRA